MDDPNDILVAAQACDPGDPAFDRTNPDTARALTSYLRSRSREDLDALIATCRPGAKPWLYELSPLSIDALMWASEGTDRNVFARLERAFRCSVFAIVDPQGHRIVAPLASDGKRAGSIAEADKGWTETVVRKHARGINVVKELGALALRRAEVGPETADPYWPLAGAPRPAF